MAYNAPELVLVGAAQQLVLEDSPIVGLKQAADFCRNPVTEDQPDEEYDIAPGW